VHDWQLRSVNKNHHFTLFWCDFQVPKCTKSKIFRGSAPNPTGEAYSALPDSLAGGEGARCPLPKNPAPLSALRVSHSAYPHFLLLARYVPNVAERSVWEQCNVEEDRPTLHFVKFRTAISRERVIRSTSCLVLVYGFRGRRIEWTHFRLDQIQDGGWAPFWKILNGRISGTDRPIDFVFDPGVGFSGTADRMALFPVSPNPRWRLTAILENFEWPYIWDELSDPLSWITEQLGGIAYRRK